MGWKCRTTPTSTRQYQAQCGSTRPQAFSIFNGEGKEECAFEVGGSSRQNQWGQMTSVQDVRQSLLPPA